MKRIALLNVALMLGVIFSSAALAGDLTPGSPPGDSMATLDEVSASAQAAQDVRTPITSLPATIETSGSYYLTDNLTLTELNTHGIFIDGADEVTIDLNGFSLVGPGAASGESGDGIHSESGVNISIFNGSVRNFRGTGVYITDSQNSEVYQMRILNNGGDGIFVSTNGTVENNAVRSNGGVGIRVGAGAVVRGNSLRENGGVGISSQGESLVIDNAVLSSGDVGISASNALIVNNLAENNSGGNISGGTSTLINNHAP